MHEIKLKSHNPGRNMGYSPYGIKVTNGEAEWIITWWNAFTSTSDGVGRLETWRKKNFRYPLVFIVSAVPLFLSFPPALVGFAAKGISYAVLRDRVTSLDRLNEHAGIVDVDITIKSEHPIVITPKKYYDQQSRILEELEIQISDRVPGWSGREEILYTIACKRAPETCDPFGDFRWSVQKTTKCYVNNEEVDSDRYSNCKNAFSSERLGKLLEQEANDLTGEEKQAKLHQAKTEYEKAFRLNPNENIYHAHAHHVQAKIHIERKDYDAAISEAQKAIDLDSTEQTTYQETKRTADKLKSIQEAANLAREGETFLSQGEFAEAEQKFKAAYEKAPDADAQKEHYKTMARAAELISQAEINIKDGNESIDEFNDYSTADEEYTKAFEKLKECPEICKFERISQLLKNLHDNFCKVKNTDQAIVVSEFHHENFGSRFSQNPCTTFYNSQQRPRDLGSIPQYSSKK